MNSELKSTDGIQRLATIELNDEQIETLNKSLGNSTKIKYLHVDEYVGKAASKINPSLVSARIVVTCW